MAETSSMVARAVGWAGRCRTALRDLVSTTAYPVAGQGRQHPLSEGMGEEESSQEAGAREPKSKSAWRKKQAELNRLARTRYKPSRVKVAGKRYEIDWLTAKRMPHVYRLLNKGGTRKRVGGDEAQTAIRAATLGR